ncbi:MAG: ShlB/FhaC/HecB family hemolysin secretion/activation protein [Caldimonas sp.]
MVGPSLRLLLCGMVALMLSIPSPASAQTTPSAPSAQPGPPPGSVPTPEQLRLTPTPSRPPDASQLPEVPKVLRELGKPADEMTLDVSSYAVDANAPERLRAALPALTAPYVGKARSYEDLVNAAATVTRFLQREMGYYLGYAYLPEQTPADGVIRIAVLEGRLDEVILNWPDKMPVKRSVVEAYLARLKPGEILRVRDVERVVFLVNDLRGLTARFEVKAGRTPGTATLVVTPQPEQRVVSRAEIDTAGSRYSGVVRASVLSTISSPLGLGDGLVVNALSSTTGGLMFGLAGYTLPVGSDGFKLGASASYVRYQLDKSLLTLDLHGNATTVTLYGLYPVVRSRNLNLFSLVSVDSKQFNDQQGPGLSQRKTSTDLQLSVSGDARDDLLSGGVNTFELSVAHGSIKLPRGAATDNAPDFTIGRLNASRLQNLVNNRLLLFMSLKGQLAFANLDSTEQFQIGGPDRVRAFAPGEGTGDSGEVLSLELRFLPPEAWFGRISRELVFTAFYDIGTAKLRHDPAQQLVAKPDFVNRLSLSGWGFGGVWDRSRDFALRLYLAWPISGTAVNDPVVKKPRIYLTANKTF